LGPVFEPLHEDPQLFRQVRVDEELGTVVWPNGADLDPDVLHGEPTQPPRDWHQIAQFVLASGERSIGGEHQQQGTVRRVTRFQSPVDSA